MRIAFTHNLKTSDDEDQAEFDTLQTVHTISELLRSLGHEVHPVDVGGPIGRLIARLETVGPDLVFNTAEGAHGRFREAFYPALFEQLALPYTGSGAHVCAITLDKQMTKMLVNQVGVPTPKWAYFDSERPYAPGCVNLKFPVIVKPNFEGSSKGVTPDSIVHDPQTLHIRMLEMVGRYPAGVLVEEFIIGRDVTVPYLEGCGVLASAAYRLEVEGVAEGFAIYDYVLKNHDSDKVHLDVPAPLPAKTLAQLERHTRIVMRELGVRDLGRADYRLTAEGEIYFIEVNALPSLEPGASIYLSAAEAGLVSEAQVLDAVLQSAIARQGIVERERLGAGCLRVGFTHNVRRVDPRSADQDAEFDAPHTIAAIGAALAGLGHTVLPLEASAELPKLLADLELDLVFNVAEGLRGRSREAQVPALLELLGIEYTGSDAVAMAVTLDKGLAKRLVRDAGLATPSWEVVAPGQRPKRELRMPVIVKPNAEGSSKGVSANSVIREHEQLPAAIDEIHARYGCGALIEEFLVGREFTVGLLGNDPPRVLPIMEIEFLPEAGSLPIYSYEHKTDVDGTVRFHVPADLEPALEGHLREFALRCFDALGCRDVARVDLRLDALGVPNFVECNPLPGLSPGFSDLCVMAEAAGLDHAALVTAILGPAVRRLELARAQAQGSEPRAGARG